MCTGLPLKGYLNISYQTTTVALIIETATKYLMGRQCRYSVDALTKGRYTFWVWDLFILCRTVI